MYKSISCGDAIVKVKSLLNSKDVKVLKGDKIIALEILPKQAIKLA